MSDKNGVAFATTPKKCDLVEEFSEEKSPDSGRESVDQLLQALRAAETRRVSRAERVLDPLRWLIQRRRL